MSRRELPSHSRQNTSREPISILMFQAVREINTLISLLQTSNLINNDVIIKTFILYRERIKLGDTTNNLIFKFLFNKLDALLEEILEEHDPTLEDQVSNIKKLVEFHLQSNS